MGLEVLVKYQCGPGFGTRGQLAYQLRESGLKWIEIQVRLDSNSESAVIKVAERYAKSRGLAWPISLPETSKPPAPPKPEQPHVIKQREAYTLRMAGQPWAKIQEGRYTAISHTIAGARRHAQREGLPWPIPS